MSFGRRPPSPVQAPNRGRLTPFSLRITPRRVAGGEGGLRAGLRLAPLERWAKGVACTAGLKHHAASREGCGSGASVGQRPPSAVRASGRGRLAPFSSRTTPRRTAGRGWRSSGRTAPSAVRASGQARLTPFSLRITPRRIAGRGRRPSGRTAPCTLERWAKGIACTAVLKHHAASREGRGLGVSFGQRPQEPGLSCPGNSRPACRKSI